MGSHGQGGDMKKPVVEQFKPKPDVVCKRQRDMTVSAKWCEQAKDYDRCAGCKHFRIRKT